VERGVERQRHESLPGRRKDSARGGLGQQRAYNALAVDVPASSSRDARGEEDGDARRQQYGEAGQLPVIEDPQGKPMDHDHGRSGRSADCRPTVCRGKRRAPAAMQMRASTGSYGTRLCRYDQEGILILQE